MADNLISLRCAIHVHTNCDDGEKSIPDVVTAAKAAGVDALLLTDHSIHKESEKGWEGWKDHLFVVIGRELSTHENDHIIALGLNDKIASRLLQTTDALSLLNNMKVTTVIAHPQGRPRMYVGRLCHSWKYWQNPDYSAIEIWAYMHDWIENLSLISLPEMCRHPDRFITGPRPEILAAWDAVAKKRRICGIGALDSHGRYLPLGLGRLLSWAREGILPYRQNFEAFSHYLLVPELSRDNRIMNNLITEAISECRGWVCHESLHSGRDFRFSALVNSDELPVGTETEFISGTTMQISSPIPAQLRLVNRGEIVASTEGGELSCDITEPGEYRVEADIDNQAWIRTNHIYLRPLKKKNILFPESYPPRR